MRAGTLELQLPAAVILKRMIVLLAAWNTASIANGMAETLIARAADVTLKERRRSFCACVRRLSIVFICAHCNASDAGAVIFPVSRLHNRPVDSTEMAQQFVCRVLAILACRNHLRMCGNGTE